MTGRASAGEGCDGGRTQRLHGVSRHLLPRQRAAPVRLPSCSMQQRQQSVSISSSDKDSCSGKRVCAADPQRAGGSTSPPQQPCLAAPAPTAPFSGSYSWEQLRESATASAPASASASASASTRVGACVRLEHGIYFLPAPPAAAAASYSRLKASMAASRRAGLTCRRRRRRR